MQQEELISRRLKRLQELGISESHLDSIGVRIKTVHILSVNGIYSLKDLVSLTDEQLINKTGIREKELEDIKRKLEKYLDSDHNYFVKSRDLDELDCIDFDISDLPDIDPDNVD